MANGVVKWLSNKRDMALSNRKMVMISLFIIPQLMGQDLNLFLKVIE